MNEPSLMLMFVVLFVLASFAAVALRGSVSPLSRPGTLRDWYGLLVRRLAKLDDLHAAEAVPADVYRPRREELKTQLASLMIRLREVEEAAGATRDDEQATVEERTKTS